MSYIVNKTNGSVLATLQDGTTNTDTGLTLIGRNYTSYGEIQNENFVRLLENFASNLPPGQSVGFAPIAGQLWWDTANTRLKVYTGTDFIPVSEQTAGTTAPSSPNTGDQWWDTTNKQLKVYNGTSWTLIAPQYTEAQGKSGSVVETVTDEDTNAHTVVNTYTNGHLISVTSYDTEFSTGAYDQFSYIKPGINLASNVVLNGTADNSLKLGSLWANAFPRTTERTDFLYDLGVAGNLVLGSANVSVVNNNLIILNSASSGNVDMYVNTTSGNTRAFRINGATGMITVASNPTNTLGVATKGYTDDIQSALNASIVANVTTINDSITQLRSDTYTDLDSNVIVLTAQLNSLDNSTTDRFTALNSAFLSNVSQINANVAYDAGRIDNIEDALLLKAAIDNPTFTGTPTAPTPSSNNNSTRIATTEYVDAADLLGTTYTDTRVDALASTTAADLADGLAGKANTVAPDLTGESTADTPGSDDNSRRIATTAFVRGVAAGPNTRWQGSQRFIETTAPDGRGSDGDFWFQIG